MKMTVVYLLALQRSAAHPQRGEPDMVHPLRLRVCCSGLSKIFSRPPTIRRLKRSMQENSPL